MGSHAKTSGKVLPKVHGVDNTTGKELIKQVVIPQSHVSTKSKDKYHVKPRLGQGGEGIKKEILRFPISLPHDKPEQLQVLPGR